MTILDRLSRLLRANVNDLISKAEDPEKIINQALLDMRSAYGEARSEVADAMTQVARLEREAGTNRKLSEEYNKKAEEALRGGSEDLAREALRRAQNHKDLARGFEDQIGVQRSTVDQLRTQLRALEAKIDEMESKKTLLAARQRPPRPEPRWTASAALTRRAARRTPSRIWSARYRAWKTATAP